MEYLMTYGWAILIVIIVAAALWALGVFNPGSFSQATKTGLAGFDVPAGGWKLTSAGALTLQLKNQAGATIKITTVNATIGTTTCTTGVISQTIASNEQYTASLSSCALLSAGASYSATVKAVYDNQDTGLTGFTSSGTLTGTVS